MRSVASVALTPLLKNISDACPWTRTAGRRSYHGRRCSAERPISFRGVSSHPRENLEEREQTVTGGLGPAWGPRDFPSQDGHQPPRDARRTGPASAGGLHGHPEQAKAVSDPGGRLRFCPRWHYSCSAIPRPSQEKHSRLMMPEFLNIQKAVML